MRIHLTTGTVCRWRWHSGFSCVHVSRAILKLVDWNSTETLQMHTENIGSFGLICSVAVVVAFSLIFVRFYFILIFVDLNFVFIHSNPWIYFRRFFHTRYCSIYLFFVCLSDFKYSNTQLTVWMLYGAMWLCMELFLFHFTLIIYMNVHFLVSLAFVDLFSLLYKHWFYSIWIFVVLFIYLIFFFECSSAIWI